MWTTMRRTALKPLKYLFNIANPIKWWYKYDDVPVFVCSNRLTVRASAHVPHINRMCNRLQRNHRTMVPYRPGSNLSNIWKWMQFVHWRMCVCACVCALASKSVIESTNRPIDQPLDGSMVGRSTHKWWKLLAMMKRIFSMFFFSCNISIGLLSF